MPKLPPQTIVDTSSDAGLSTIYTQTPQQIPIAAANTTVYITNRVETVTNIINQDIAGGDTTEVQFNIGDRLVGDSGFTYDAASDSLNVAGNITVGALKTNNILYANGAPWSFGSGSYANSNVANYLPIYNGNITANNFAANIISGNGSGITFITAASVNGAVSNSAFATTAGTAGTAGTVTTGGQPNITSLGTLSSLSVTGTASASLFTGSGANLTNINGSNVTGVVGNATVAVRAGTVTTNAQPNITSVGTLASLAVSGNVSASHYTGNGSLLTGITATIAQTVSNNAQPNITSTGTLSGLEVNGTANFGAINSNGIMFISNTAPSTNRTSGALIVSGGIGSNANIHGTHIHAESNVYAAERVYAGENAIAGITFSTEVFVGKTTSETFIQTALINSSGNGSADYTSFGDNGDDDEGWTSLGFTGTTFNDPEFTISKESDGYVFVEGMTNQGGNLILATGETGDPVYRDIIFATGGFLANNERFRYSHSTNKLIPYANATMDLGNTTNYFSNVYANKFIGDGSLLTGVIAAPGNAIVNGNSTVSIASVDGDISISANGANWSFDTSGNLNFTANGIINNLANSSGDGYGYSTMQLVPDSSLYSNDQYLVIDPTAPNHIHIRAGGAQDDSNALLFLGGEKTHVKIDDQFGVSMQYETVGSNTYFYANITNFTSGSWFTESGSYFVEFTTTDSNMISNFGSFISGGANVMEVSDGIGFTTLTYGGSSSQPGPNTYKVQVVEAPINDPSSLTQINFEIFTNRVNSLTLTSNDFRVEVTDDVRIFSNDTFRLINKSSNEPVQIITDDNNASYNFDFHANGSFGVPGDIFVSSSASPAPSLNGFSSITFADSTIQGSAFTDAQANLLANAIVWTSAPVSNVSAGTAGEAAYDAGGNLYICVATNTWAKFTGTTSW